MRLVLYLLAMVTGSAACNIPLYASETYNCLWECNPGFKMVDNSYCCPINAPAGTLSVCTQSGYEFVQCPANANIEYTGSDVGDNTCIYPWCVAGYVPSAAEQQSLVQHCSVQNGVYDATGCGNVIANFCKTPCPNGLMVEIDYNGNYILDANGNTQCVPCTTCPPGSFAGEACSGARMAICAICTTHNGVCVTGQTVAGAVLVTFQYSVDLLNGYFNNLVLVYKTDLPLATYDPINKTLTPIPQLQWPSPSNPSPVWKAGVNLQAYIDCPAKSGLMALGTPMTYTCTTLPCGTPDVSAFCSYVPCTNPLPVNAQYSQGCNWTCLSGWYGPACTLQCTGLHVAGPNCACADGWYGALCDQPCVTCLPGQYQKSCSECAPCTVCNINAGFFQSQACSATSDTVCKQCSACLGNSVLASACTATSDTICHGCTPCPPNQYVTQYCSAQGPTTCAPCSNCPPGQYAVGKCWGNSNTFCASCGKLPVFATWTVGCNWTCNAGFTPVDNQYCDRQDLVLNGGSLNQAQLGQTTANQVACQQTQIQSTMSHYFKSPTLLMSVSDSQTSLPCYPSACPCTPARRLSSVGGSGGTVSMQFWYAGSQQDTSNLSMAIPNLISVQSSVPVTSSDPGFWTQTNIILVAAGGGVLVLLTVLYLEYSHRNAVYSKLDANAAQLDVPIRLRYQY